MIHEEDKQEWIRKQFVIAQEAILHDDHEWSIDDLRLVGGVDLSFVKDNDQLAVASLVIIESPSLKVLHEDFKWVQLSVPYISGLLSMREGPPLVEMIQVLKPLLLLLPP
eukprot:Platyproteum_vivax@DN1991_c0_g1_i1.p1